MKLQPRLKPNFNFKEIISLFKPRYRSVAYFERNLQKSLITRTGLCFLTEE